MVQHPTKTYHKAPYPAISPLRPESSQAGKTVLVTGGATGIGYAISKAFITAGAAKVIIVGRRSAVINSALSKLTAEGTPDTQVIGKTCDIADLESTKLLWSELAKDNIFVDVLVLNAAKLSEEQPILELGLAKIWEDYTVNVRSVMDFAERFHGQPGGSGHRKVIGLFEICGSNRLHFTIQAVVNVSSASIHNWSGQARNRPAYGLTKSSGTLLLQQIALHTKCEDMQIVSFHPGTIYTDMARGAGYSKSSGIPWDDGKQF